jgi:hypothetical protein
MITVIGSTETLTLELAAAVSTTQPEFYITYSNESDNSLGNSKGVFNSMTPVTAVASPATAFRSIASIFVTNLDSASVTVIAKATGGTTRHVAILEVAAGSYVDILNPVDVTVTTNITGNGGNDNILINSDGAVNQQTVSGSVVLAAGEYGHDRMKAGSSGCSYTFATVAGITTFTISAGSLLQIVETTGAGDHTLSWVGTTQATLDGGASAASPITETLTGGLNVVCEWSTGTLSKFKLEPGVTASDYVKPDTEIELARCRRYLPAFNSTGVASVLPVTGLMANTTQGNMTYIFDTEARVPPTGVSVSDGTHFTLTDGVTNTACTAVALGGIISTKACQLQMTASSALTQFRTMHCYSNNAAGQILFTGCEL